MWKNHPLEMIFLSILLYSINISAEYQAGINYGISKYFYEDTFDNDFQSNLVINFPVFINFDWGFTEHFGTQSRIGIVNRESKQTIAEGSFENGRLVYLGDVDFITSNYYLFLTNKIYSQFKNTIVSPYISIGMGINYYMFSNYNHSDQHVQKEYFKKLFLTIEPEIGIEKALNEFVLRGCIGFSKNITDVHEYDNRSHIIYGSIGIGYIFQSNRKEQ